MHHIMIISPEHSPLKAADKWLSRYGFQVNLSHSFGQANKFYELNDFDLLLVDNDCLVEADSKQLENTPPRIVLDTRPSLNIAVSAMSAGAKYYLPLPTDSDTLLKHVIGVLDNHTPSSKPSKATSTSKEKGAPLLFARTEKEEQSLRLGNEDSTIIGHCPEMEELFSDIRKVASTDVTVLIRGESGTGKELVAKALHDLSKRNNKPLISVNCAAIPENLIESELFGHEKGAFTGASAARDGLIYAADQGTLFLDEIGELPLEAQARLLRVLQEGEIRRVGAVHATKVDIRLVTATHRDLMDMVKKRQFREDLYYRLYVMELIIPPLRERGDDISMIAKSLLEKTCKKHNRPQLNYNKAFDKAIRSHNWPGNVRELENAIERAVILSPINKLEAENLKISSRHTSQTARDKDESMSSSDTTILPSGTAKPVGTTLDDYFKHFVLTHQHKMTETQLAHSLGISRKSLWERRQKQGIPKKVTEEK